MRDYEAERNAGLISEAVHGIRSLRGRKSVSKTARATVIVYSPSWTLELAMELQQAMDTFRCNAKVYWKDGQSIWTAKQGAQ